MKGRMHTMTYTLRNSVIINRPVNDVFGFVTDPTTTPQWQANLVRSDILTPGPMRVGTRVLEVRRLGKSEKQAEWRSPRMSHQLGVGIPIPLASAPFDNRGSAPSNRQRQGPSSALPSTLRPIFRSICCFLSWHGSCGSKTTRALLSSNKCLKPIPLHL